MEKFYETEEEWLLGEFQNEKTQVPFSDSPPLWFRHSDYELIPPRNRKEKIHWIKAKPGASLEWYNPFDESEQILKDFLELQINKKNKLIPIYLKDRKNSRELIQEEGKLHLEFIKKYGLFGIIWERNLKEFPPPELTSRPRHIGDKKSSMTEVAKREVKALELLQQGFELPDRKTILFCPVCGEKPYYLWEVSNHSLEIFCKSCNKSVMVYVKNEEAFAYSEGYKAFFPFSNPPPPPIFGKLGLDVDFQEENINKIFLEQYAEPVHSIMGMSGMAEISDHFNEVNNSRFHGLEFKETGIGVTPKDNNWEIAWSYKNLMGALKIMYCLNLANAMGKRYKVCELEGCNNIFEVTKPTKLYCSDNHGNLARVRRHKKKKGVKKSE